jgi:hypothetical protein
MEAADWMNANEHTLLERPTGQENESHFADHSARDSRRERSSIHVLKLSNCVLYLPTWASLQYGALKVLYLSTQAFQTR